METAIAIVILAIFGEAVIEAAKPLLEPATANVPRLYLYLSALLGVALAATYQANLLLAVGLEGGGPAGHWIGVVGTGIVIGRGANYAHDVLGRLGQGSQ